MEILVCMLSMIGWRLLQIRPMCNCFYKNWPPFQTWRELLLGQNFTQDDVDRNTVRYVHTGGREKSSTDFFVFQVNDGQHRMPKETFDIEIISSKGKEIAVLNKGLAVKEGDSR